MIPWSDQFLKNVPEQLDPGGLKIAEIHHAVYVTVEIEIGKPEVDRYGKSFACTALSAPLQIFPRACLSSALHPPECHRKRWPVSHVPGCRFHRPQYLVVVSCHHHPISAELQVDRVPRTKSSVKKERNFRASEDGHLRGVVGKSLDRKHRRSFPCLPCCGETSYG